MGKDLTGLTIMMGSSFQAFSVTRVGATRFRDFESKIIICPTVTMGTITI